MRLISEAEILVCFALRQLVFEIQGCRKSEMHQIDPKLNRWPGRSLRLLDPRDHWRSPVSFYGGVCKLVLGGAPPLFYVKSVALTLNSQNVLYIH